MRYGIFAAILIFAATFGGADKVYAQQRPICDDRRILVGGQTISPLKEAKIAVKRLRRQGQEIAKTGVAEEQARIAENMRSNAQHLFQEMQIWTADLNVELDNLPQEWSGFSAYETLGTALKVQHECLRLDATPLILERSGIANEFLATDTLWKPLTQSYVTQLANFITQNEAAISGIIAGAGTSDDLTPLIDKLQWAKAHLTLPASLMRDGTVSASVEKLKQWEKDSVRLRILLIQREQREKERTKDLLKQREALEEQLRPLRKQRAENQMLLGEIGEWRKAKKGIQYLRTLTAIEPNVQLQVSCIADDGPHGRVMSLRAVIIADETERARFKAAQKADPTTARYQPQYKWDPAKTFLDGAPVKVRPGRRNGERLRNVFSLSLVDIDIAAKNLARSHPMAEHRINRREKKGLYVTRYVNGNHLPNKGYFDLWKLIDGPEKLLSGTDAAGRTVPLVNIGGGEDSDFRRMVTVCWGL